MKYFFIFFLFMFNAVILNGQIEVGLKTGIQMLGMFRSSANIFGDGEKVFNPSYGIRVGHKIGENLDLSLDGDFTSGNYHNLAQNVPLDNETWQHVSYSLINTSVLLTYKFNSQFGIRSGLHIFFVGEITAEFNGIADFGNPNVVFLSTFPSSRAIGIPLAIAFEKNRFELEIKWVGGVKEFVARERAYRRLETFSINIFYNFKSKK